MCFFSIPNLNIKSKAYLKGITSFKCGSCPECLREKASYWALRCSMESKKSPGVMVTLTYDTYIRDKYGRIIGERVSDLNVCKRDCQLFIKRLRKYFDRLDGRKIKYLLTAEYGKRTHRAHYHALLFNVTFKDIQFYKLSKRGNAIYTSDTLNKLWQNGICTVDAVNITGKTARYCTKYCAKDSGAEDTFMLFSHGIGDDYLFKEFNGKSYLIDGREYTIPKSIWNTYISHVACNIDKNLPLVYKYVAPPRIEKCLNYLDYQFSQALYDYYTYLRELFIQVKESNLLYQGYLNYWKSKAEIWDNDRPDDLIRILRLPNDKYYAYKQEALRVKNAWRKEIPLVVPRSKRVSAFYKFLWEKYHIMPLSSCHKAANDTISNLNSSEFSFFPQKYNFEQIEFNLNGIPDEYKNAVLDNFLKDCPF